MSRPPLNEITPNITIPTPLPPAPKKPRKPYDLSNRPRKPAPARQRIKRSYTREKKISVLQFLLHERVYDTSPEFPPYIKARVREGQDWDGCWRPCTNAEASDWFKIPEATIGNWWRQRDQIVAQRKGTRTDRRGVRVPKDGAAVSKDRTAVPKDGVDEKIPILCTTTPSAGDVQENTDVVLHNKIAQYGE